MMRFLVSAGILMALACLLAQAADKKPTYAIVLERPSKVGETYHIAVTGLNEQTTKVSADGKIIQDRKDKYSIRLDGTVKVLLVNAQQRAVKESITITRCVKLIGEKEMPLAVKGTVIIAASGKQQNNFTINGKPVGNELQQACSMAISLPNNDASVPTDDMVYGTKKRQHVGDSWSINTDKIAARMAKSTFGIAAENITGRATLKDILKVGGKPCMRITSQTKIGKMTLRSLPPEMKVENSSATASTISILPIDRAKRPVETQEVLTIQFKASGKPNAKAPMMMMLINSSVKRTVTIKYSNVK